MAIKTLDELRAIKEQNTNKIGLRHGEGAGSKEGQILVGMATCGIAAGARETLNAFVALLAERGIGSVRVVPVGCLGYCKWEPLVGVLLPGAKPVTYGNIDPKKAATIVERHVMGGAPVEELTVPIDFDRI